MQSERYADGVPFLEQARALDPDSWATYLYLGKARLKLHDNAEAVHYLQQAAEMNRDEASVFYLLASAVRPRVAMKKRELRCDASRNCTPIPSNWIARCTSPWWPERV